MLLIYVHVPMLVFFFTELEVLDGVLTLIPTLPISEVTRIPSINLDNALSEDLIMPHLGYILGPMNPQTDMVLISM